MRSIYGRDRSTRLRVARVPGLAWVAVLFQGLAACGVTAEEDVIAAAQTRGEPVVTWNEFASSVYREPWAGGLYIVDGDIPVNGDDELFEYYLSYAAGGDALTVNRIFSGDDVWAYPQRFLLRYCVSDTFGARKAQVVSTIARAAASWHDLVGVRFVYEPAQDAACDAANASVTFDVRPVVTTLYSARAFFPSDTRVNRNLLITDNAFTTTAGGRDFEGILRHELGHTLGFRHEHIHLTPACTPETADGSRQLTSYDVNSVMHYPQCRPSGAGGYRQTALDFTGARSLYGTSPQLIAAANSVLL